jgi:hypothetical protein
MKDRKARRKKRTVSQLPPCEEWSIVAPDDPRPIQAFLREYAALVRKTGIYVDPEMGLAMPIDSPTNEMDSPEEHIARLYREECLIPPDVSVETTRTDRTRESSREA